MADSLFCPVTGTGFIPNSLIVVDVCAVKALSGTSITKRNANYQGVGYNYSAFSVVKLLRTSLLCCESYKIEHMQLQWAVYHLGCASALYSVHIRTKSPMTHFSEGILVFKQQMTIYEYVYEGQGTVIK